jgi:hypothetical protein
MPTAAEALKWGCIVILIVSIVGIVTGIVGTICSLFLRVNPLGWLTIASLCIAIWLCLFLLVKWALQQTICPPTL